MNKRELTPDDLKKAIQFLKENSIRSDAVSLDRLVEWLNVPRLDKDMKFLVKENSCTTEIINK